MPRLARPQPSPSCSPPRRQNRLRSSPRPLRRLPHRCPASRWRQVSAPASPWLDSSDLVCPASSSTRVTAATIRVRRGKAGSPKRSSCSTSPFGWKCCLGRYAGVEVILTRHTDEFVPLPERTAIANREGADLFLSIHANASPNDQAHGVETYFLNFANNLSAAAVAARENATSGQAMGALPDFVRAIALNNKLDESRDFATLVQQSMVERLRPTNTTVKDLGVKQAPLSSLDRRVDAERACGDLVPDARAGGEAAQEQRLSTTDCRSALRRRPTACGVAQTHRDRRTSVGQPGRGGRHPATFPCLPDRLPPYPPGYARKAQGRLPFVGGVARDGSRLRKRRRPAEWPRRASNWKDIIVANPGCSAM